MNKRKAKKLIKKLGFEEVVKFGPLKYKFTFQGLDFYERKAKMPNFDL